ncbi:hypothetical protein TNIN_16111 [Trichonephila inaurata madagascariensis]|uniref:Uncharacterized protein n=1 Tax=Trichonephila inaurata madagascariensis TaxID=2747483 RepID=A0A8X6IK39_9ARAC|nr:hypothetical protein TNIN_16111 [Trichonephila inaurata madagascariensis]
MRLRRATSLSKQQGSIYPSWNIKINLEKSPPSSSSYYSATQRDSRERYYSGWNTPSFSFDRSGKMPATPPRTQKG